MLCAGLSLSTGMTVPSQGCHAAGVCDWVCVCFLRQQNRTQLAVTPHKSIRSMASRMSPTCHRLLQRAWGGHLRGQRHLKQVRYLLAHSTAPAFPSTVQVLPLPLAPSYLLIRGVTVAVRGTQRHL